MHAGPGDGDADGCVVEAHEQGQGLAPHLFLRRKTFPFNSRKASYIGATVEGTFSQAMSSQCNMSGVWAEDSRRDYEDSMEADTTPTVAGQLEDADVDG